MCRKKMIFAVAASVLLGCFAQGGRLCAMQAQLSTVETCDVATVQPTATPSPATVESEAAQPQEVKDDKTWKADLKAVKKEIDTARKESKAVLKEIKKLKKNYESILKKMQKNPTSVTITAEDLEQAKGKLSEIESGNEAIQRNTDAVKAETSVYNSLYRSKDYAGAYGSYQRILSYEKQITADYSRVEACYSDILNYFVVI